MKPRLLLALSGTKQSLYASELAFKLAEKTEASVTAQHVIDTFTSWELLRNDQPGLLGINLYNDAFINLKKSQKNIANELGATWKTFAEKQSVDFDYFIDEGNPVKEICKRAQSHDLVIVGHRRRWQEETDIDPWHGVKYTVAEGLAHDCPKPLLIVQNTVENLWKRVVVVVSSEHINFEFLRACNGMSGVLGAHTAVKCFIKDGDEQAVRNMLNEIFDEYPDLASMEIRFGHAEDMGLNSTENLHSSLLVLPTRIVDGKRVSILGEAAELFVRRLSLPAILLWPEESVYSIEKIDTEKDIIQQKEVSYESSHSSGRQTIRRSN